MNMKYTCKLNKEKSFDITLKKGVFQPTGTSDEIVKAVSKTIINPAKILDLGCGSGVVGFALYFLGKVEDRLYASDLSEKAVLLIEENAKQLDIPVLARFGNMFDPWENECFDYIVDDVSGISEEVAKISPWFKETSCKSGEDGTNLVIEAIKKSPFHLNPGGKFIFPILSLSNTQKVIKKAQSVYKKVERIGHKQWRFPDEMEKHMDKLVDLRSKGLINFEEKYGWLLWTTDVYLAESPK